MKGEKVVFGFGKRLEKKIYTEKFGGSIGEK